MPTSDKVEVKEIQYGSILGKNKTLYDALSLFEQASLFSGKQAEKAQVVLDCFSRIPKFDEIKDYRVLIIPQPTSKGRTDEKFFRLSYTQVAEICEKIIAVENQVKSVFSVLYPDRIADTGAAKKADDYDFLG